MEVTLGGQRLGSGNKNKVSMRNYERSTHDLGYVWRSTMASGTLVPFMVEVALPGDTFDIELDCDILTHPTIGPLFGTYKVQLDVFQIPIRLYQAQLHMNMLGIGMNMSQIKLPQITLQGNPIDITKPIDNQQVSPSSIFSYLGIRGLGQNSGLTTEFTRRDFCAVPYLAYWDIYKNYYANKQEEIGAVIHVDFSTPTITLIACELRNSTPELNIPVVFDPLGEPQYSVCQTGSHMVISITAGVPNVSPSDFLMRVTGTTYPNPFYIALEDLFDVWEYNQTTGILLGTGSKAVTMGEGLGYYDIQLSTAALTSTDTEPIITTFPLSNIDEMRKQILMAANSTSAFTINDAMNLPPYDLPLQFLGDKYCIQYAQEGLALKTYQSDLFNNWISTEWIDGPDGISAITAIDTSAGSFTIDELNMSKKVYDMLNRIALSGGSYDDWLDAVYTHDRQRSAENPMYIGGLMQNLVFQEVISNSRAIGQPLGTLAGRGKMGSKRKGGKVVAKVDEPSYLMGIISITPNIDYSQGNKWDTNLKTMDDFHKPALDEIGFQDLVTDQMAWWDTLITNRTSPTEQSFKSAGKQPAWINYMTNVNVVRGNFAEQSQQMFMVLNRRYTMEWNGTHASIGDLTTYIDPSKFNHIFADTRRDAQNFWAQIGVNMTARRKMSAKVMPNL